MSREYVIHHNEHVYVLSSSEYLKELEELGNVCFEDISDKLKVFVADSVELKEGWKVIGKLDRERFDYAFKVFAYLLASKKLKEIRRKRV